MSSVGEYETNLLPETESHPFKKNIIIKKMNFYLHIIVSYNKLLYFQLGVNFLLKSH